LTGDASRLLGHLVTSIEANRRLWNKISTEYQRNHDPRIGAAPRLWGCYSIPDSELGALGGVTGERVLELGCGAGQWSRSIAEEAEHVVGFDLSEAQLAAAAAAMGSARYGLVQGAAEQLPFAADSFDLVFCDEGALLWAPPDIAVPEAARVLRRGGRLVFTVMSPWATVCFDDASEAVTTTLNHDYFTLGRVDEADGATAYSQTYGGWVRTLRRAGLIIDDLIEPHPGPDERNGYGTMEPPDWAHHWPIEMLWVTHKAG
jgi:ubiquinone/menaquinone biosynthesis C-methylase UbiE